MEIKASDQKEFIRWAYRLILDREAESEAVLERNFPDTQTLRNEFMRGGEYSLNAVENAPYEELWVLHESCYGFKIYVNLGETAISWFVLRDSYEPEETKLVQSLVRPGDVALDIGANIGYYSLLMAAIVGSGGGGGIQL